MEMQKRCCFVVLVVGLCVFSGTSARPQRDIAGQSQLASAGKLHGTQKRQVTTPVSLAYQPMKPFYASANPANTISQIVPPGQRWPSNADNYNNFSQILPTLINRFKETTAKPQAIEKPGQPSRPSFHPNPGDTVAQIVPPGQPWPSNAEDYANFSQTSPPLINRFKETTEKPIVTSTTEKKPANVVLEYEPMRPSFHPNPGDNLGQIVPPGKPWPSNAEDYANFSQTSPPLINRFKETTEKPVITGTTETNPTISLEYEPMRPSFHPNPGNNIVQVIPPGQPWPSNVEDYSNFSQTLPSIVDRFKETTEKPILTTTTVKNPLLNLGPQPGLSLPSTSQKPAVSLDYKPMRPSFHPNPGNNIAQIVPPGQPWPSNAEDYANFSQTQPSIVDRFKETTEKLMVTSSTERKPDISLEYEAMRPPFHPNPGNNIGQIVPSGQSLPSKPDVENRFNANNSTDEMSPSHPKPGESLGQIVSQGEPWPANAEGYKNFSQTTKGPSEDRRQNYDNVAPIVPPGKPWPSYHEGYGSTTTEKQVNSESSTTERHHLYTSAAIVTEASTKPKEPINVVNPQVIVVKFPPPLVPLQIMPMHHFPHFIYHYPRFNL